MIFDATRYWYVAMDVFKLYRSPIPVSLGGYCDKDDFCPDYARVLDAAYCWIYWMSAWAVAEVVILYLPGHRDADESSAPLGTPSAESGIEEATATTPLLPSDESNSVHSTTSTSSPRDEGPTESDPHSSSPSPARVVNVVGILLATAAVMVTGG